MSRVLTKGSLDPSDGPSDWTNYTISTGNDNPKPTLYSEEHLFYYAHAGVDTKNFHKLKREGKLLPFTPWEQVSYSGNYARKTNWNENGTYHSDVIGPYSWYPGPTQFPIGKLEGLIQEVDYDSLVQQAAARIYASGFDTLTFLAELHKTRRMFQDMLSRNLDNLLSGRLYKNWLEARYGWRILILEMQDLYNTIENLDDTRTRFKERAGRTERNIDSWVETHDLGFAVAKWNFNDEIEISYRGSVVMDIEPPSFQFNPIVTAWELIPYSFVIDWFIGIGNWLEAMSALHFSTGHVAAGGVQATLKRTCKSLAPTWATGWSGTLDSESNCTVEYTKRIPTTIPKSLPSAGTGLNVSKIIDMLALIAAKARF